MVGIYKITSPSNRTYIGQSINIKIRWAKHRSLVDSHKSSRLCSSFKSHGVESHIFEILEECEVSQLNERERFYQDFYDVLGPNGLNCKLTESSDLSGYRSIESRKRMSEAQLNRSVEKKNKTKKKAAETYNNKTFEEKQKTRDRISETQLKRTQEEKDRIANKANLTKKNKSLEQKEETKKRKSESALLYNKTKCPIKEAERRRKISETQRLKRESKLKI